MGHLRTFAANDADVISDVQDRIAHRSLREHSDRLLPEMYAVEAP